MVNEYAEVPAPKPDRAENILADRPRTDDKDFQPDQEALGIWQKAQLGVLGFRLAKNIVQLYSERDTMNNTTKTMLISTVVATLVKGAIMLHWLPSSIDDATAQNIGTGVATIWITVFGIAAALGHHANSQAVSQTK